MIEERMEDIDADGLRLVATGREIPEKMVERMNNQLYQILARKMSGNPLQTVKNIADTVGYPGARAWARILETGQGRNENLAMIFTQKVRKPKRIHKFNKVMPAFEVWESYAKKWERTSPAELNQDMARLSSLDSFEEMRKYVIQQVAIRREPYLHTNPNKSRVERNENVPMETRAIEVPEEITMTRSSEGQRQGQGLQRHMPLPRTMGTAPVGVQPQ